MSNFSIIVTCSFIPSHPKISVIKETIESLKTYLLNLPRNTPLILAHDYSNNQNYTQYLHNLNEYLCNDNFFNNYKILLKPSHGHLTGNIRNVFTNNLIQTPYVLVIQHDLKFINYIDINKIIEDIQESNDTIKYIRFNKRNNIRTGFDALNNLFGKQLSLNNYTYTQTPAWSDNNHFCKTSYYTHLVLQECQDGRPMEEFLHKKNINEETQKHYGTYLFGPLNHPQMIYHTDGKYFR